MDPLLMEEESIGDLLSTCPWAQTFLEAPRRCFGCSKQRPRSSQDTVPLPQGIRACDSAEEKTISQKLLRSKGTALPGQLSFWKGGEGMAVRAHGQCVWQEWTKPPLSHRSLCSSMDPWHVPALSPAG